jgi:hypothetical protein
MYIEWGVLVVFAGTIGGIFWKQKSGYGRFNTSVLVMTLVLFTASMAFFMGKIETQSFSNILFAVAGYIGGLLVPKEPNS